MVVHVCQCCFLSPSHPLLPPLWPGARLAPCATRLRPTGRLCHTWWCVYVSAAFSVHPTLSFPRCGRVPGWLPVLHGSGPLVGCFAHGGACMSVLLSQPIRPLLPPLWPGARLAPCTTRQQPTSWLFHTWWCMYVSAAFSVHPGLSFPRCVHKSILCV